MNFPIDAFRHSSIALAASDECAAACIIIQRKKLLIVINRHLRFRLSLAFLLSHDFSMSLLTFRSALGQQVSNIRYEKEERGQSHWTDSFGWDDKHRRHYYESWKQSVYVTDPSHR